jgi:hypothetical protein
MDGRFGAFYYVSIFSGLHLADTFFYVANLRVGASRFNAIFMAGP